MPDLRRHFQRYLIAGLLVWIPIWVTLLVLHFIVSILDGVFDLLPKAWQPQYLFGVHIPGLGVIFSILIVFLTGLLVTNFLGRWLVQMGELIVQRIPIVRSIYIATKQVIETLFSSSSQSFRKVVLVEYPRKGIWSVAFMTSDSAQELKQKSGQDLISIFIPTTPNPTSGFLMMVPKDDVKELDMTIDQALKFIISLGVVTPPSMQPGIQLPTGTSL